MLLANRLLWATPCRLPPKSPVVRFCMELVEQLRFFGSDGFVGKAGFLRVPQEGCNKRGRLQTRTNAREQGQTQTNVGLRKQTQATRTNAKSKNDTPFDAPPFAAAQVLACVCAVLRPGIVSGSGFCSWRAVPTVLVLLSLPRRFRLPVLLVSCAIQKIP